MTAGNIPEGVNISIHALVKRATKLTELSDWSESISIHALVKRATAIINFITVGMSHFNPRPREEGDADFTSVATVAILISIHALVKRATWSHWVREFKSFISIHALVKRATIYHIIKILQT